MSCARNWMFALTLTIAVAALPDVVTRNVGVSEAGIVDFRADFCCVALVRVRSRNQSLLARVPRSEFATTVGARGLANVPLPNPPVLLYPQQCTVPALVTA